jgi:hypothetical protein
VFLDHFTTTWIQIDGRAVDYIATDCSAAGRRCPAPENPTDLCQCALRARPQRGFTIHEVLRLCYGSADSGDGRAFPGTATQMLPNFKIVIGGVLIFVLLFAVTGAGVVTPQVYTRIGAMPEIGRPLMQRVMADESAQLSTALRRGDEVRQRELATLVAISVPQAAPDPDEAAMNERAQDEKSDGVAEPIAAANASTSAAPPSGGLDSIAATPAVSTAKGELVAATAAAPAARPTGAAAALILDADQAKPTANALPQAGPASRQGALDADLAKSGDGTHSANSDAPKSDVPKRRHRIAAHARKRLAAVHRARQAAPAPNSTPAFNPFGPTAFQSHF